MGDFLEVNFYPESKEVTENRTLKSRLWMSCSVNILLFIILCLFLYYYGFNWSYKTPITPSPAKPLAVIPKKDTLFHAGYSLISDSSKNFLDFKEHVALLKKDLATEVPAIVHKVTSKETIYSISKKYNISREELIKLNNIKNNIIRKGQVLKINEGKQSLGHYGIDVSHWQGEIDWQQVHADTSPKSLTFFIIKATEGSDGKDEYFDSNWQQAQTPTSKVGAYHFYVFKDHPVEQAHNYLASVKPLLSQGSILPIIDIEYNCRGCKNLGISETQFQEDLKQYISTIEDSLGVTPLLYSNPYFYNKYLKEEFSHYYFWMAKYSKTKPQGLSIDGKVSSTILPETFIWQFSSREKIQGIKNFVDMNYLPAQNLESILINRDAF